MVLLIALSISFEASVKAILMYFSPMLLITPLATAGSSLTVT